jgi:transposase-like protein
MRERSAASRVDGRCAYRSSRCGCHLRPAPPSPRPSHPGRGLTGVAAPLRGWTVWSASLSANVLSLYAKGLTTGELQAHLAESPRRQCKLVSCTWCVTVSDTSRKYWAQISRELRDIYTAPTVEAAQARFGEFAENWRALYPAMVLSWESSWEEFVPFLELPIELRRIVYTTNAIESLRSGGSSRQRADLRLHRQSQDARLARVQAPQSTKAAANRKPTTD